MIQRLINWWRSLATIWQMPNGDIVVTRNGADPDRRVFEFEQPALPDPEPERLMGGWVHRAALGTLPTWTTHQGVYAALPEKE